MSVFAFERKEVRLLRLFLKACLLRLIREEAAKEDIRSRLKVISLAVKIDLAFQQRPVMERSVLNLLNTSLDKLLVKEENLSKEQWEAELSIKLDELAEDWNGMKVEHI